jgi:hypothetical protein
MNEQNEQKITRYKKFIQELAASQDEAYARLLSELDVCARVEGFLFDYVYNEKVEDCSSFTEYLLRFSKGGSVCESTKGK